MKKTFITARNIIGVAGLLLALIDIPDFGTPLRSIAGSVEKIANAPPGEAAEAGPETKPAQAVGRDSPPATEKSAAAKERSRTNV